MQNQLMPKFGSTPIGKVSKFDLQMHLNWLSERYSRSVVSKVRTWVKAVLAEAMEEGFIEKNPALKLKMPATREPCNRFLTRPEITRLLCGLEGRDRLIVRLFIVCGFRPGELFALRWRVLNDGVSIRIEEAIAQAEKGRKLGEPKTRASKKPVALPRALREELEEWRRQCGNPDDESFIFPSARGTPMHRHNHLKRRLQPLAKKLGIEGLTYQALRRTHATYFQRHGDVKDTQAQLRHANASTTMNIYVQSIPESQMAAAEALNKEISRLLESFDQEISGLLNTNEHKFEM